MGQDWSEIWLQNFSGTITLWPRTVASDFVYILSDPTPERLARMLQVGQQSAFGKLLFIANRMKIERLIEKGLRLDSGLGSSSYGRDSMHIGHTRRPSLLEEEEAEEAAVSSDEDETEMGFLTPRSYTSEGRRASGVMEELKRQSGVFFDDSFEEGTDGSGTDGDEVVEDGPTKID